MKQTLLILLSACVLISGLGFRVNKMVCLSSGKVEVSFFRQIDCCENEYSTTNVVKSRCCDFSSKCYKVNLPYIIKSVFNVIPFIPSFPARIFKSDFSFFSRSNGIHLSFSSSISPHSGRTLLNLIQLLLI